MQNQLEALRNTAAKLLSQAVCELFPKAVPLEGHGTARGFYQDFFFPQDFTKDALLHIHERMAQLVRDDLEITCREMMTSNAVEYFLHQNKRIQAGIVERSEEQFVEVFQMRDFVDICPTPYLASSGELKHFHLSEYFTTGEKREARLRILGLAFDNKQDLKQALKQERKNRPTLHLDEALQEGYFERGRDFSVLNLPKGQTLVERARMELASRYLDEGFYLCPVESEKHLIQLAKSEKQRENFRCFSVFTAQEGQHLPYWGWFSPQEATVCEEWTLCKDGDLNALLSFLQFFEGIANIHSFGMQIRHVPFYESGRGQAQASRLLKEALKKMGGSIDQEIFKESFTALDLHYVDRYGREWEGGTLRVQPVKEGFIVYGRIFPSLEAYLALLWEQNAAVPKIFFK